MLGGRLSSRQPKAVESPFEGITAWPMTLGLGECDLGPMEGLERVFEGRAVLFREDIVTYVNLEVRRDAQKEGVKGCMVECAKGDAIGHKRFPRGVCIGDEVSRVEKFEVPQSAKSALCLIGVEDSFPERALVEASASQTGDISTAICGSFVK